ncbi:MAG TPA: 4'-phosphopantetheinyl transferase superfamily protein [Acidimicrobiales bacterium]|nr:4'-phosphopantetheinyl transferase superfamily protein [Acidimicrobiales bacterium]
MSSNGSADPARTVRFHAAGQHEVPDHDDWLTPADAARFATMRFTKRRDESRLGRWTAKGAVARALDRPVEHAALRAISIRNAADGAPEAFVDDAPAGVAISMTDRAGWAVCLVAEGTDALGCDLELVEPRSHRFVADYFTPREQEMVAAAPDDHDLLANLVWSAKESALKVLRQGLRLDTRTVEVALLDAEIGAWRALAVTTADGERFDGWWIRHGDFVLTCCARGGAAAPVPMQDPSPLTTAAPVHSWLAAPRRELPGGEFGSEQGGGADDRLPGDTPSS